MLDRNKYRVEQLDILKALGIVCMVSGHAYAPFTKFVYLFHMAIFFIASGFFYKDKNSQDIQSVFKAFWKKVKRLYIPLFIWNTIYTLLHNLFIHINVYTDNPQLLNYVSGKWICITEYYSKYDIIMRIIEGTIFSSSEQMFGTEWFLRVLFMTSIFYLIFDYIIKHLFKQRHVLIQFIIATILLIFGFSCYKIFNNSFYGIAQTCSFYCLYFLGYILQRYKDKYSNWNWKQYIPALFVSFLILLLLNGIGSIELGQNRYENPVFLLLASSSGWLLLYSLSYFIKKYIYLKKIMIEIGKHTLAIMILHFLSFKIVELFIVNYYGMPLFCVAAFPNLFGSMGLWWLAYTIIGVIVPIILSIVYHNFIDKIYNQHLPKKTI